MNKIVIDARELRTTSGRYVERLLNYLQVIDKDNNYSVLLKPKDLDNLVVANSNFKKIGCKYKEFSFSEQFALKKQIKKLQPDLVHFTFPQQPILYRGKTLTTIHDLTTLRFTNPSKNRLVFWFKQKVFGFVIKRAANKSFKVIVPSNYVKDDLVQFSGVDPAKVVVTYESADPIIDEAEPVLELDGKPFIMYVGRPMPHKNLKRLIEAFVSLQDAHPNLVLALAGKNDANYDHIKAAVKKRGFKNVVFTGFVSEGQLKWLYQNCSAYVFPSLSEGFGLPGLEAMLHGAPVVSSNATCLPEIYGNAAHYFDPLSKKGMASAINEVLTDKALRQKLIDDGKKQAAKYSWERMAKQTLEIYKEALDTA